MNNIAVLIPCYNECTTIEKVVREFRAELPSAQIFVYDNNSTDGTGRLASSAGASVRLVRHQGKGNVVRRMFQEIDADVYILVDGDDTYPANEVSKLICAVENGEADMSCGDRLSATYYSENKRLGHGFGNWLVCRLIRLLWGQKVSDVMTGYRAFSNRFVKTCPVLSPGFEIETEMTLHALDKRMSIVEIPIQYHDRQSGSYSKLNTVSDGIKVLGTVFNMFRYYRPIAFFTLIGIMLAATSVVMGAPVFAEYFRTGLVLKFPTLIFACFLFTAALLSFSVGLVLDAVKKQSDQAFELALASASLKLTR